MKKGSIYTVLIYTLCFGYSNLTAQNLLYPIVDSHFHPKITSADEGCKTMEEYFSENESINIKYLFGLNIAKKGKSEETKTRNDSLFSMARRDSRFIPVCSVYPNDGEVAIEELRRIKNLGGKIIKLHPHHQDFSTNILSEGVFNVARVAGELGLVILIDGYGVVAPNYLEHLLILALNNPQTKFIIAHMGGSDFHKLGGFKLVQTVAPEMFKNVWYDISATVNIYADSPYKSQFEWTIRSVGVDRVLFASDNPIVSLSEALNAFYKLDFDDTERERILSKNVIELLGL
jgi:predicted TIM-barrel fold metal-dependent hydrolase